jgi:centromeric protein E
VNDLLAPQNVKLPVHESREAGVYVCGLREDIVTCRQDVLALLEQGEANRHIGSTRMNEKSSRSHTLFRMVRRGANGGVWGVEGKEKGRELDHMVKWAHDSCC